jgi:glutamate carboxypeptidase
MGGALYIPAMIATLHRSLALLALAPAVAGAQSLTPREVRIKAFVAANYEDAVRLLARAVNIGSGTLDLAGVRAVGTLFRRELDQLGFTTQWVELPPALHRAGHLVAERLGSNADPAGKRLLLIGHLDTVFEGGGRRFVRRDGVARGAGVEDMKGGDVAIVLALKALRSVGALDRMRVIVVLTGDEENAGRPTAVARKALVDAARRSDAALAFEGGNATTATIARRGASEWVLRVSGHQTHSSGIFKGAAGYGAIFEAARILDGFRQRLDRQAYLTLSPGAIVGGTDVTFDTVAIRGRTSGKTNIVPRTVVVAGDLRTLTRGQLDSARAVMREVVAQSLPGTRASISFDDGYPGMPPTDGNRALLAEFDRVSQALGWGPVEALPPERRGAGDIAFVAEIEP